MRSGRKSAAQTPAPKKDRIYGSKTNPKGSASSEKSAKSIVLSDKTMKSLQEKLKEFKEKYPAKKNITLNDLKAVYRRGLGAYSSSHRPTITGGVPNTRNAWAMARVNKFLLKAGGAEVKKAYVQDDDLMMAEGGRLDEISKTIKDLVSEWNVSACEINKGECFVFADVLESKLRQKGYDAEFLSNDYFYNTASEEAKHDEVLWYNEKDYNSEKPENLIWEGYHAWVYVNGKHYDAETPDGVVNFYDLPIFKKKRYADGSELDNYSVAIKENGLQQPFEWNAYNSEENIYVPENEIYAFLYNAPNTQDKIDDDALIFSNNRGLGNFWEDLKTQKGSESLVAILKGRLSEDKTKLYILTMTTKNEFRKKGLMSKLIREVRSKYNIDKENVIFIGLTDMGQKMYKKKRYAEGGELNEIKLPDLNMSYGALKKTLNYQGYDIEPMKQELQIGKVAKGMSVQQIAQHHNTTVDEIQKQLDKGIQVEMEHTDNQDIARAIALDHVYESPVYYDKLETIEFKDGGVVVGKRHSEYDENGSGEKFLVESTGQVVELEGGEGVLCQESMSSDKKFSFEGKSMTGREIASYLNHKYGGVEFAKGGEVKKIDKIKADMPHVCGCKHQYYHGGEVPTAVVRNLKGGEAVVTVKSMESKDQYNFNGKPMTPRQIFSHINMASGGKKFEDGGVINLQSIKDDARLEFDIQLAKMMYYVTTLKQMI